jgi:hypothetical protein
MIKIQCVLYPLLLMIFVSLFISLSHSQGVTNQSTVNSSIINGSIKNDSSVTVLNGVGDIDCSNHLDNQLKKDNADILIILGDLCYKSDLRVFNSTYGHFKEDNTTLLIGLNTNGDIKSQAKWGQSSLTNGTYMKGIKNVMLMVHGS